MAVKNKVKRLRYVYSTASEVLHLWANQTQDSARTPGGNGRGMHGYNGTSRLFFEGRDAYSYGRHYKLATLKKINGRIVALIRHDSYSVTTGTHIRDAEHAAEHLPVIRVDDSFNWKAGLIREQATLIADLFDCLNGRSFYSSYRVFDSYTRDRFKRFNEVCDAVGMPQLKLEVPDELIQLLQAHIKACVKREEQRRAERLTPEGVARLEAERVKRDAAKLRKEQASIELWKAGKIHAIPNAARTLSTQLIRIHNDSVETSRGARVPLADAVAAFRAIEAGTANKGMPVGPFRFDGLEGNIIRIGCHRISIEEARSVLGMRKAAA